MRMHALQIALITQMAVSVLVLLLIFILYSKRSKRHVAEMERIRQIIQGLNLTAPLDMNINVILQGISSLIRVPYYAVYILEPRTNRYLLKVVSHPFDGFEETGPAYSGLALPKREQYVPPLEVRSPDSILPVQLLRDGDVPLVLLQTANRKVLIRLGPVSSMVRSVRRELQHFIKQYSDLIEQLIETESAKTRRDILALAERSVQNIAGIATDRLRAVEVLIRYFSGIQNISRTVFVENIESHDSNVFDITTGLKSNQLLEFRLEEIEVLRELVNRQTHGIVTRRSDAFYKIPQHLTENNVGAMAFINITDGGLLLLFYSLNFNEELFSRDGLNQLRMLGDQLRDLSRYGDMQQRYGKSYAQMLWRMSSIVDNFTPYTVGYSDMMTRYSLVIGKRLNMTDGELEDLALAAHMSNIGVLGLNMELVTKEGKYSDVEYETMKLHCEIGSAIVQIATGNKRAANYVLFHHERVDGYGFPMGISDAEIPLGAKIIHVVQVFLAKINGRAGRPPLTFEKAIDTLMASSGSQLDSSVVGAFVDWWQESGGVKEVQGRAMAHCFDLCCTPKEICTGCPVRVRTEVNCWEVKDNKCASHGRECSTCFVRTEYLYRLQRA